MDSAAAKVSLAIISSSSSGSGNINSCSKSDIGSGSDSDSTSGCGSSNILTWTGKYKLGVIVGARVRKYNLVTRAGKCKVECLDW